MKTAGVAEWNETFYPAGWPAQGNEWMKDKNNWRLVLDWMVSFHWSWMDVGCLVDLLFGGLWAAAQPMAPPRRANINKQTTLHSIQQRKESEWNERSNLSGSQPISLVDGAHCWLNGMEGPRAQAEKANPTPIDCWPARSAAINGIGLSFLFFFRNNEEWIVVGYRPEASLPQHHSAPQLILPCSASAALPILLSYWREDERCGMSLIWFIKERVKEWRKRLIDWVWRAFPLITNSPAIQRKALMEGAANNPFNQSFLHSPKEN